MPELSPHDTYAARSAALSTETEQNTVMVRRARITLRISLLLTLLLLLGTLRLGVPVGLAFVPGLLTAAAMLRMLHLRRLLQRLTRLRTLYTRAFARLDGKAPQSGHTGEAFRTADHLYDRDLAILGLDSLFGLLCTVRTGVGQRGLANDLLLPHNPDATADRQAAIQELTPLTDLREHIHLLGASDFQQLPATFFDTWLTTSPPAFHPALRICLITITSTYLLLTVIGLVHLAPWAILRPLILLLLALQSALAFSVRRRVLPLLDSSSRLSNELRMFRDGIALLQGRTFASSCLADLQQQTRTPTNSLALLTAVERQFIVVEQRTKNISLILSLFLAAGTHAALSIAAWKRQNAAAMQQWLAAWATFESLNALATYAFEHPANTYPELLPAAAAHFEATDLAHPLLPATAVPNDLHLSPSRSLLLISGSNMAGKSTLLRALGLNAVLAAAGAPIRAASARISPLALGASIALTDSLAEGKSKFLAEVERLHAILALASGTTPVLFLVDEIFSGTNSTDRRIAAEAVARTLIERGSVGALSTHDLTLTAMADDPALRAANVHMSSPDPDDPLAFDYLLKPGINTSTNALAILRLIGIGVEAGVTAPGA